MTQLKPLFVIMEIIRIPYLLRLKHIEYYALVKFIFNLNAAIAPTQCGL